MFHLNADAIGGGLTEKQAREVVARLRARGYEVEYGESFSDGLEIPSDELWELREEVRDEISDD